MTTTVQTRTGVETMNAAAIRERVLEEIQASTGIESGAIVAGVFGPRSKSSAAQWKNNMRRVSSALGCLRRQGRVDRIYPESSSPWVSTNEV